MDVVAYDTTEPVVVLAAPDVDRADATALAGEGVDCRLADGVAEALDAVDAAERADCVVTAADLADGTGIELLDALRSGGGASGADGGSAADRDRALRGAHDTDVPVIYVPETGTVGDAEAATAAGATVYLPRDRAAEELADRLTDVIEAYDRRRQLGRERELFTALLEDAPLSLYAKDAEARHVAVSSYVAAGFEESPLGRTDEEIYGDPGATESYRDDLAVLETGEPIVEKVARAVARDGEVGWYRTTKQPWRTPDGEIQGLVGVTVPVTEAKERERQLERQRRRLEQFATFTSTDLREPVSAARQGLQRARAAMERAGDDERPAPADGDSLAPAADEALATVGTELDRIQSLIERLLTMARPQAEAPDLDWVELADAADRSWSAIEGTTVAFENRIEEPLEIEADADQLHRCLEQLYRAALERGDSAAASDSGDGTRSVDSADASEASPTTDRIEVGLTEEGFYVADDGPAFDVPADPAAEDFEYRGAGRRVAIARDVAEAHGWSFDVETPAEGGVRFVVEDCLLRPAGLPDATEGPAVELVESGDVGGAEPAGEASRDAVEHGSTSPDSQARRDAQGVWTVHGGGRNVFQDVREFHGVWAPVEGDVRIEARIADLEPVHERCKAAVGFYDPADDRAPLSLVGLTGTEATETMGRATAGAPIANRLVPDEGGAGVYYRVDRVGDRTVHSTSPDGEDWTVVDHRRFRGPEAVAAGLAVCSYSSRRRTTAVFEDVRVCPLEVSESP